MTAGIEADRLSLSELERHDPGAPRGSGRERRFLCPFPACADKQHPQRHRSLAVNVDTGAYYCHRCQARGGLEDPSFQRPFQPAPPRQRLRQAFTVQRRTAPTTEALEHAERVGVPIGDAPEALAYVGGRGIPLELATEAGLRFCATWSAAADADHRGWPGAVFPMRDQAGNFIAAHGRAIRGPRKLTRGPTSSTVFATPGALSASTFAITEGQMDALSLAFLTIARRTELEEEDRAYLERLRADDAVVEQVYQLVQGFMQMLRGRQGERLDAWIEQAQDGGIDELRRFAAGLLMDHAAVHAGLTHVWSNGTVEGHVNRLKLLKRQMYGRQFRPAPPACAPRRLTDDRLTDQPGELPPVHRECGSSDLLYTSWQYRWPNNRRLASPEAMW